MKQIIKEIGTGTLKELQRLGKTLLRLGELIVIGILIFTVGGLGFSGFYRLGFDQGQSIFGCLAILFVCYAVYWVVKEKLAGRNPLPIWNQRVESFLSFLIKSLAVLAKFAFWGGLVIIALLVFAGIISFIAGLSATSVIIVLLLLIWLK